MIEFISYDPEAGVYWGLDSDNNLKWLGAESLIIEALIKDGMSPSDAREVVLIARTNRGTWIPTRKEREIQKYRSPKFKGKVEAGQIKDLIRIAISDISDMVNFLVEDLEGLKEKSDLIKDYERLQELESLIVEARQLIKEML